MRILSSALALLAVAGAASAAEPYAVYDGFGGGPLNTAKWLSPERSRAISGGVLVMSQRDIGDQYSNSGSRYQEFTAPLDEPAEVNRMRADVAVTSLAIAGCAANVTDLAVAGALLRGSFFNVGTPVPGNQTGDVHAFVYVAWTTEPGLPAPLVVGGEVEQCTNFDCSENVVLGEGADLGTANIGEVVRLQMDWDAPNNRFTFTRGTAAGLSVNYSVPDTAAPSRPAKELLTLTRTPNCLAGPRTVASVAATFDNLSVNQSAAP